MSSFLVSPALSPSPEHKETTVLSILIPCLGWKGLSVSSEMLVTIWYPQRIPRQEFWILFNFFMKNMPFSYRLRYTWTFKGFWISLNMSKDSTWRIHALELNGHSFYVVSKRGESSTPSIWSETIYLVLLAYRCTFQLFLQVRNIRVEKNKIYN